MSRTHRIAAAVGTAVLTAAAAGPAAAAYATAPASPPGPDSEITSTNVPTHIEVGTRPVVIHDTVTTRDPATAVEVTLTHPTKPGQKPEIIVGQDLGGGPATSFAGQLFFTAAQIPGWGRQYWEFVAALPMHNYDAQLPVEVRQHSLLAMSTHRAGSTVTVDGSARQLSPALTSWVAWPDTAVHVQRWSQTGWITVAAVTTDSHGNLTRTLHIPWRVGLRLIDTATPTSWGQTTPATAV